MFRRICLAMLFLASFFIIYHAQSTFADDTASEETPKLTPAETEFFEKKIRPVLVEKCYQCHSAKSEKVRGGLLLDTKAGLLNGGDNGPSIVPGDPDSSPLIQAIRYTKPDYAMPPKNSGGKLPENVIKDFEEWVKMGAPDPRAGKPSKTVKKDIYAEAKKWWAFQPLTPSPSPRGGEGSQWTYNEIDRFVLATLQSKNLKPVGDADPLTLLRRVSFDLTGLPPTPEAQDQFLAACKTPSNRQAAYTKVVDELLASPRFGEHWGRHWLDVARFAESTGKDVNIAYPHAWRYRDYVIDSLNRDKPYDQFLKEQLAGDLMPARDDKERAERLIATGFLALGAKSINEQNPMQFAVDAADEMIDSASQAIMGVTVACARCHDHKFDPISQKDYTAWAGIFLSTEMKHGTAGGVQSRNSGPLIELPKKAEAPIVAKGMTREERQKKEKEVEKLREELRQAIADRARNDGGINVVRLSAQVARLQNEINITNEDGSPKALAMGVADKPIASTGPGGRPLLQGKGGPLPGKAGPLGGRRFQQFSTIGDSPLFARGEVTKPTTKVPRGTLSFFSEQPLVISKTESGRRQLSDWMVEQPLTARVMANRSWHWLFGKGLVPSVDNFGMSGETPSHPELLEYLANTFKNEGWSLKKLLRTIVLSHTYQLASTMDKKAFEVDPDNKYLWRHSPRRLDAEQIRDAMLQASGILQTIPPVGSLIGKAGDGPIGGPRFQGMSEAQLLNAENEHRSIYLPSARNVAPVMLSTFDKPDGDMVQGARESTNVPGQALFMLNSDLLKSQSEKLVERLVTQYPGNGLDKFTERFTLAIKLVYNRLPTKAESDLARNYLVKLGANRSRTEGQKAWVSLCRSLFAAAEFRLLE
ncbi:MAG: DUF1549 domain-containing protein [Gemmatales bacterium]